MIVRLIAVGLIFVVLISGGCQGPPGRIGSLPSRTLFTGFPDPNDLGVHRSASEKNGQVYTCKVGHIDLAHARMAIDWTAFLADKTYKNLLADNTEFSFKLKEPSVFFVELTYPENWKDMSREQKEVLAREISIRLGAYFTFTGANWHEILTWFGYKSVGFFSEFSSAFSWEDTMSDLLGTYVADEAIRDTNRSFNEAATLALNRWLEMLEVQPSSVARVASERVRGLWYSDLVFHTVMKKRNLNIGLVDGFVAPWTVSSISQCDETEPETFRVPNADFLSEYGFSMSFAIEPRGWEARKILSIVYPDAKKRNNCLEPAVHFSPIMEYIAQDAVKRYGPTVQKGD